ncbi:MULTISPECIES: lipopolysaccharide biosynthesis protein [unclassified Nocardioides]|uniref:lipopolysaccharide biosynthesis protein n=1 Tax=unclassified Nocardioides TaxID=2615069 RepID=UPI003611D285
MIAATGLLTAAAQVRYAGAQTYGLISVISTLSLLLPFADLGLGAAVTTAVADRRSEPAAMWATLRAARTRLTLVACSGVLVCAAVSLSGQWERLLGAQLTTLGQMAAGLAVAAFFISVPFGLAQRILVGLDQSHVAALIPAGASLVNLVLTLAVIAVGAPPILMSIAMPLGVCLAFAVMLLVALRALKRQHVPRPVGDHPPKLLAGSGAMLLISIGLPLGLQSGRLLLSHTSDLGAVANFAIGSQFYGMAWGVMSAAGMALWPAFVRLRADADNSLRQWQQATIAFSSIGVVGAAALGLLSPTVARLMTGGRVDVSIALGSSFGLLLLAQAMHLPSGMMLTKPRELWWQAGCVIAMACVAVVGAAMTASTWGAVAVPLWAGIAVVSCQVIPDQLMTRRLLNRRQPLACGVTSVT